MASFSCRCVGCSVLSLRFLAYLELKFTTAYALSRIEGRPGSPEKPLSDLGRIGYESYWARELVGLLHKHGAEIEQISIDELSRQTGILQTDVKDTLERLNVIRYEQGEHILHISDALIQKYLAPVRYFLALFFAYFVLTSLGCFYRGKSTRREFMWDSVRKICFIIPHSFWQRVAKFCAKESAADQREPTFRC